MNTVSRKRLPPFWLVVILLFLLYGLLSVGLTRVFGLPWRIPIPLALRLSIGIPLLAFGVGMYVWCNRSLGLRRALGKELFKPAAESTLVTTGAYAYSRNAIYLSVTLLLLGLCCVSRSTPIAIATVFGFVHFMLVAKWEERELTERLGKEYLDYKQRVPFFIPSIRRRPGKTGESSRVGH
ncbi:MAG: isoprenylcysteine carboxylmethyltransferase family protein [Spirochaetes bacterium]|nr:isoprenylcysteine carboxylmethyltransferase family protein [Spirochaetota bacterium]